MCYPLGGHFRIDNEASVLVLKIRKIGGWVLYNAVGGRWVDFLELCPGKSPCEIIKVLLLLTLVIHVKRVSGLEESCPSLVWRSSLLELGHDFIVLTHSCLLFVCLTLWLIFSLFLRCRR